MRRLHIVLLSTAALMLAANGASAGPSGGTVVGGSATINNQGSANVSIHQ
jgi:hypothetical protein